MTTQKLFYPFLLKIMLNCVGISPKKPNTRKNYFRMEKEVSELTVFARDAKYFRVNNENMDLWKEMYLNRI
jgi:hypothetical protein